MTVRTARIRLLVRKGLSAAHSYIDEARVDLAGEANAPAALGGSERAAAAGERLIDLLNGA